MTKFLLHSLIHYSLFWYCTHYPSIYIGNAINEITSNASSKTHNINKSLLSQFSHSSYLWHSTQYLNINDPSTLQRLCLHNFYTSVIIAEGWIGRSAYMTVHLYDFDIDVYFEIYLIILYKDLECFIAVKNNRAI
jgi:hypothetical protein